MNPIMPVLRFYFNDILRADGLNLPVIMMSTEPYEMREVNPDSTLAHTYSNTLPDKASRIFREMRWKGYIKNRIFSAETYYGVMK